MTSYPKNIRPFKEADLDAVCDLYQKIQRDPKQKAPAGLRSDFKSYFLDNVWSDPEIPSLVYEENGKIIGFIGSHVRPLQYNGKRVRAAYSGQLVSDPQGRARAAGAFLMKAYIEGPQDITMTDGATAAVAQIWTQLGGDIAHARCLRWTRILRPTRFFSSKLGERNMLAVSAALKPFSTLLDPIAGKLMSSEYKPSAKKQSDEKLTVKTWLENVDSIYPASQLKGNYSEDQLSWLLEKVSALVSRGRFEEHVVRDEKERVIGWFMYFLADDGQAQVLQIAAKPKLQKAVLEDLFNHAYQRGCVALQGRVEPSFMQSLDDVGCMFRYWGPSTLVHSRDPELLLAYQSGHDFLTRLDGEWWMAFHRDEYR